MPIPISPARTAADRRDSIRANLRLVMARWRSVPGESVQLDTTLGHDFKAIVREVAQIEGATVHRTGPLTTTSTFNQAVEFLMTAVQE